MRKKKLLLRISELESENDRLKDNEDYWKDLIMQFAKGLHEHGVEVEIVFPEPEMIKCSSLEDVGEEHVPGAPRYIPGRTTELPLISRSMTKK